MSKLKAFHRFDAKATFGSPFFPHIQHKVTVSLVQNHDTLVVTGAAIDFAVKCFVYSIINPLNIGKDEPVSYVERTGVLEVEGNCSIGETGSTTLKILFKAAVSQWHERYILQFEPILKGYWLPTPTIACAKGNKCDEFMIHDLFCVDRCVVATKNLEPSAIQDGIFFNAKGGKGKQIKIRAHIEDARGKVLNDPVPLKLSLGLQGVHRYNLGREDLARLDDALKVKTEKLVLDKNTGECEIEFRIKDLSSKLPGKLKDLPYVVYVDVGGEVGSHTLMTSSAKVPESFLVMSKKNKKSGMEVYTDSMLACCHLIYSSSSWCLPRRT